MKPWQAEAQARAPLVALLAVIDMACLLWLAVVVVGLF